jgi:organic hydroperoxide reductase OsmC/OhrA
VAEHGATVEWRSDGEFASGRYSRAHVLRFDGGAEVRGSSSPHVVPVPMSDPAGVDPEEALIASASACHMLWFLHVARDGGFDVARYRDAATGEMGKDDRSRMAITRIVLRPEIDFVGKAPDAEALARLHDQAHEACFIANTLRCEVVVDDSSESVKGPEDSPP